MFDVKHISIISMEEISKTSNRNAFLYLYYI
jgi:hypothetical protein